MNEMKKLTAEILPHLQARKVLQKLGCKQVVIPEVRTAGKTGNMVQGMCHDNVAELVSRCGGKHLTGYSIIKRGEKMTQLTLHSIWETPEGKFVEVTKLRNGEFRDTGLFAILYESKQGAPFKVPQYENTMLIDESNVRFIRKGCYKTEVSIPWNRLKSKVTKLLAPKVCDCSVQGEEHWDYQRELQNCWKQVA